MIHLCRLTIAFRIQLRWTKPANLRFATDARQELRLMDVLGPDTTVLQGYKETMMSCRVVVSPGYGCDMTTSGVELIMLWFSPLTVSTVCFFSVIPASCFSLHSAPPSERTR